MLRAATLPATLLAALLCNAAAVPAQVPAPDFWVDPIWSNPVSFDLGFRVQGPPNAPVQILFTLDNPFTLPPPPITVYPLLQGHTNANGQFTASISVPSWQGPLPDVWFGALVAPAGQQPYLAGLVDFGGIMACAACGNVLATHATMFLYERLTGRQGVRVKSLQPNEPLTIWEVQGNCPAPGQAWTPGANATLAAIATTDANGCLNWTGTVAAAPGKCLVVRTNGQAGVALGVKRY